MRHSRSRWLAFPLLLLAALSAPAPARAEDKPDKLPVPNTASQEEAGKTIAEVFKDELAKAKTAEEKSALAGKFLALAAKGGDEPPGRFVLFKNARELASDSGDSKTALAAIDAMAAQFEFDALAMKLETLNKAFKSLKLAPQRKDFVTAAHEVAGAALAADQYDAADDSGNLALRVARIANDPALIAQSAALVKNTAEVKAAHAKLKDDLDALDKSPSDPAANLAVGKFYCFMKGDWEKGLAMLVLGSDAELKSLADRETKAPTEGDAMITLGDDWWAFGEKSSGAAQHNIRLHAAAWYTQASPKVSAFVRAKLDKRLAVLTPAERESPGVTGATVLRRVLAIRHADGSPRTAVHIKDLRFDTTWADSRWAGCDAGFEFSFIRKLTLTIDEKDFTADMYSTLALVIFYHTRANGYGTSPTLLMLSGNPGMIRSSKLYTIAAAKQNAGAPATDGRAGESGKLLYLASTDVPETIYHTILRYNGDKADIANVVNLPEEKHYDLDLGKWAPKNWDGGAWVIFNASNPQNSSAFVRGHLDVPGLRVDRR